MKVHKWINLYRVVPRLVLILILYILLKVVWWFLSLEAPTIEQATFAAGLQLGAVGFCKFYMDANKVNKKE